ncbi:Hypothetical Protein FCC1311_048292 [Hondaea fermentalgiana]|uniref:Uncharacterized protein n=1 Tax=Hondaea fermentalgiana TaxID=2315210 RepID=A0A2R5GFS5_9STRA|nr:Hypothetical Protein FCC1311_048292 [Hondaea fermentalgiana]|eukprot:GBG28608.1 Hypothetical Protein FCC1311_048292 [Hondaea fermentalgiana]
MGKELIVPNNASPQQIVLFARAWAYIKRYNMNASLKQKMRSMVSMWYFLPSWAGQTKQDPMCNSIRDAWVKAILRVARADVNFALMRQELQAAIAFRLFHQLESEDAVELRERCEALRHLASEPPPLDVLDAGHGASTGDTWSRLTHRQGCELVRKIAYKILHAEDILSAIDYPNIDYVTVLRVLTSDFSTRNPLDCWAALGAWSEKKVEALRVYAWELLMLYDDELVAELHFHAICHKLGVEESVLESFRANFAELRPCPFADCDSRACFEVVRLLKGYYSMQTSVNLSHEFFNGLATLSALGIHRELIRQVRKSSGPARAFMMLHLQSTIGAVGAWGGVWRGRTLASIFNLTEETRAEILAVAQKSHDALVESMVPGSNAVEKVCALFDIPALIGHGDVLIILGFSGVDGPIPLKTMEGVYEECDHSVIHSFGACIMSMLLEKAEEQQGKGGDPNALAERVMNMVTGASVGAPDAFKRFILEKSGIGLELSLVEMFMSSVRKHDPLGAARREWALADKKVTMDAEQQRALAGHVIRGLELCADRTALKDGAAYHTDAVLVLWVDEMASCYLDGVAVIEMIGVDVLRAIATQRGNACCRNHLGTLFQDNFGELGPWERSLIKYITGVDADGDSEITPHLNDLVNKVFKSPDRPRHCGDLVWHI